MKKNTTSVTINCPEKCREKEAQSLIKRIERYTEAVSRGNYVQPQDCCPRCCENPTCFKVHDIRDRSFRCIVTLYVHIIKSLIVRWKCPLCKATFTHYPDFALPHKRYVFVDLLRLSGNYLKDEPEHQTYRKTASEEDNLIAYKCEPDSVDNRFLCHSTPWRWLSFWGNQFHLLDHQDTQHPIALKIAPILSYKYRSEKRKSVLLRAQLVLWAYQCLIRTTFPSFAT